MHYTEDDMKTATIQVRIEPKLKSDVEKILDKMGISASQAISMFYSSIKLNKGIPFEMKVPNRATREAMEDVRLRRNLYTVKDPDNFIQEILESDD
jgi:DNA-damage-inducible protein J